MLESHAGFEILARDAEIMDMVALMRRIVSEFTSKNSRFKISDV